MNYATMNIDDFNRLGLSRVLPLLSLAACLSVAASAADQMPERSDQKAAVRQPVPVTITWAMAERFGPGYDRNRDGRPDLPNSYEYVNPGRYEVQLAACVDATAVPARTCPAPGRSTAVTGRPSCGRPGRSRRSGYRQGTYSVTVTVLLADGRTGSARETIRVKDILIVALGDSLASGEGNPEKPACWTEARDSASVPPRPPRPVRAGPLGRWRP